MVSISKNLIIIYLSLRTHELLANLFHFNNEHRGLFLHIITKIPCFILLLKHLLGTELILTLAMRNLTNVSDLIIGQISWKWYRLLDLSWGVTFCSDKIGPQNQTWSNYNTEAHVTSQWQIQFNNTLWYIILCKTTCLSWRLLVYVCVLVCACVCEYPNMISQY